MRGRNRRSTTSGTTMGMASRGQLRWFFFDLGKPELVGEVDFCWVKSVRLEWVGKV